MDFEAEFGILVPALLKIFDRIVGLNMDENQLIPAAEIVKNHSISIVDLVFRLPEIEFDDFITWSSNSIIADDVLEHIGDHNQILRNFYRIHNAGGILITSLSTENIICRPFESKGDGHILRTETQINSLLENIWSNFTEIGRLNVLLFFLLRIIHKCAEV